MTKQDVMLAMRQVGLIPVVRAASAEEAMLLIQAIAAGGVTVMEVTMTVPGAIGLMSRLCREHPEVLVGAGTVLDPETAARCIDAGARFIVSPALNLATIELCRQRETVILPGALTPTEIVTAWQAGADAIKVFPASAMGGASYLRSVRAPLPDVVLVPTGGVSQSTAADFLAAGAYALGVGADLVDVRALREGRAAEITRNAAAYLQIVRSFREANDAAAA